MALLIAIGSLTAGVIIGVVATYRFSNTSPVKVRQLEQQIEDLQQTHKAYRENVSTHFNTTAELIQQMTESYKDVYHHLASGAQTLCDHDVADKMLPAGERDRLFREENPATEEPRKTDGDAHAHDRADEPHAEPEPPRDYADRSAGGGALSEDYGLGKPAASTEPAASTDSAGDTDSPGAKTAGSTGRPVNETPAPHAVDDRKAETEESEEPPLRSTETADPDAPYRRPATTGEEETQRKAAGEAVTTNTESTDKDSVHKG